jgi:hypothetical protein
MDKVENLYKILEEIQSKLAEGWSVGILSRAPFTNEVGNPLVAYEIVLEKK